MLVTLRPGRPQGTMRLKWSRLVVTLRARPCMETQRRTRTPRAAILEGAESGEWRVDSGHSEARLLL